VALSQGSDSEGRTAAAGDTGSGTGVAFGHARLSSFLMWH